MKSQQLMSALMMAVGAMLLAFGLYASDSIADRMSNFFTGHFTDATSWYLIGGAMLLVVGAVSLCFPRRRKLF